MRLIINSRRLALVAGCLLSVVALVAAGCGNDDTDDTADLPTVIATTSIWGDVVANVACDGLADVGTLIPPGGDPHAFQPSLSDRGNMESAALIVANGLFLEEGLEDTIDAVEEAGTPVFRVADHVSTIEFASTMGHGHDEHEDEDEPRRARPRRRGRPRRPRRQTTTRTTTRRPRRGRARRDHDEQTTTRTSTTRRRRRGHDDDHEDEDEHDEHEDEHAMRTRTTVMTPMCGSIPFEWPMRCPRSAKRWPRMQA